MNPDSARLELARRAWQASRPGHAEVSARVERTRRALCTSRTKPARRLPPLVVAFALVFGAALAYAATAAWRSGTEPATEMTTTTEQEGAPTTSNVESAHRPATPAPGARRAVAPRARLAATGSSASAVPVASATKGASRRRPNAGSGASWADVDDALARGAEGDAERALDTLARSDSATDRAKALFGLAQLAASRGDCARARELVERLAALPETSDLAARGRRLVDGCRTRPATD